MRFGNQALAFFLLHLAAAKGEVYTYRGDRKQTFKAPKDGFWRITAVGAKGGGCSGCDKDTCEYYKGGSICYKCDALYHNGGYGARAAGTFYLRKGDEIEMFVGGMGQDCQPIRQQLPVDLNTTTPDGRDYLEALTGAGGGGGTRVRVKYHDGGEQLLLAAGGGGGAAKFFHGEDGEDGPSGGWEWGGKDGGGGGLGPYLGLLGVFGGAGGGGVSGDGDSRYAQFYNIQGLQENGEVWAEGGFSLSNGSQGGYVDREENGKVSSPTAIEITARSGSAGGYGSGGQGGPGE